MVEPHQPRPGRIASIDALRGLTILLMIFVNDVAGVFGAPWWMQHYFHDDFLNIHDDYANGMTFVDVIFPAFLFIVGMAIPFAIGRRLERGQSPLGIAGHVLVRTLGLLILGVFMVNTPAEGGVLPPALWDLLMYLCAILVWTALPREAGPRRTLQITLRGVGIIGLITLAILFRGSGEERALIELRPQWWGILGLIGWAYLVGCTAYTLFHRSLAALVGVMALLHCVFLAAGVGFFDSLPVLGWINRHVAIGSMIGSHGAITVAGVILGVILKPDSPIQGHHARLRWATLYGLALFAAGMLLHQLDSREGVETLFMINKNIATPPWCLLSCAFTVWTWVALYLLMDVAGWKRWTVVFKPAGENPLLAYLLAPVLYSLFTLVDFSLYSQLGEQFSTGFWRSVVFAFAVTWLTGGLKRLGIQLRL